VSTGCREDISGEQLRQICVQNLNSVAVQLVFFPPSGELGRTQRSVPKKVQAIETQPPVDLDIDERLH
jgi:hypothetical protein